MKHITQILLILITLSLITSCEKSDPLAACKADPTCEYFSCKVDGKSWTPYCESAFLGCDAVDVQYYEETGGLSIVASNNLSNDGIRINLTKIFTVDSLYGFKYNDSVITRYFIKNEIETKGYFADTSIFSYIKLIKIDNSNFLLEGLFQFIGADQEGDKIEISEGQFRQQYRF